MPRPSPSCYSSFKWAHDTDNDCSLLSLELFVQNNNDAKLTYDIFSVLNSCEIYPWQIFTLLLEDKYLIVSRVNIKKNWIRWIGWIRLRESFHSKTRRQYMIQGTNFTCMIILSKSPNKLASLSSWNWKFFNPNWHGGGGMMAPQNVFPHCAQTVRRRKLKLGDF